MLEARVSKVVVVLKDGKTSLMGVAEYYGDLVNFKVDYDYETLDIKGFLDDLREKLAEDFGLPVYRIDVNPEMIAGKLDQHEALQ